MFPGSTIIGSSNANSSNHAERSRTHSPVQSGAQCNSEVVGRAQNEAEAFQDMRSALERAKDGIARVKNNTANARRTEARADELRMGELWDISVQSAGFMITSAENFLLGIMGPGGKFINESARAAVLKDIFSPLLIKAMCSMYSAHYSLRLVGRINRNSEVGLTVADVIASLSYAIGSAHKLSCTRGGSYGESTALFCVMSRSAHVLAESLSQLARVSNRETSCEISASVAMLTGLLGLLAPTAPASAVESFNQYYPAVVSSIINQVRSIGDADIHNAGNIPLAKRLKDVIVNAAFVDLYVMKSIGHYKETELLSDCPGGLLEEMDAGTIAEDVHAKVNGVSSRLCESLRNSTPSALSLDTSPYESGSGSIVDSILRCRGDSSRRVSRAGSIFSCSATSDFSAVDLGERPGSMLSASSCSSISQSVSELNL